MYDGINAQVNAKGGISKWLFNKALAAKTAELKRGAHTLMNLHSYARVMLHSYTRILIYSHTCILIQVLLEETAFGIS